MRLPSLLALAIALTVIPSAPAQPSSPVHSYLGFDANEYPGDALLPALRQHFAFVGYWLNNPPGATTNPWVGKRETLRRAGFGFLVVANGRLDKEILKSRKAGVSPTALGRRDAAEAIAAAHREGFPAHTILFLDQEDGGRLLSEQSEYVLTWTEAVARSSFRPGVYASGQPVDDDKGPDGRIITITTIQDIRQHVAAEHLHPIAFWVYNDSCPPAPGCVVAPANPPAPDLSGTLGSTAWQFAQSPRRSSITRACANTYRNGNCYAPGIDNVTLDLNSSNSPDPSHGR